MWLNEKHLWDEDELTGNIESGEALELSNCILPWFLWQKIAARRWISGLWTEIAELWKINLEEEDKKVNWISDLDSDVFTVMRGI